MFLQKFFSKKLETIQKQQFLLAINSVIYIASINKTWKLYNDYPIIEYRWVFDSLRLTDNETVDWLIEFVEKINNNDK
jgi:hypothetical protein